MAALTIPGLGGLLQAAELLHVLGARGVALVDQAAQVLVALRDLLGAGVDVEAASAGAGEQTLRMKPCWGLPGLGRGGIGPGASGWDAEGGAYNSGAAAANPYRMRAQGTSPTYS